jgi:hypothetical protein
MRVLHHFTLWTCGLASPQTFYTSAECACLERHAAGRTRLAEIGCWHGVNTRRLRRAMHPDGVLFGIDPYAPGRLGFSAQRVISQYEVNKEVNGSMQWIRMTDIDAARWFVTSKQAPLDFLFSDARNCWDGFRATWEAWSPLVAAGSRYILGSSRPTVEMPIEGAASVLYTREVIVHDPRFRVVETVGMLTVLEKL